ncbi:hypothetical protein, partial [Desulfatitalea alkaliphila]
HGMPCPYEGPALAIGIHFVRQASIGCIHLHWQRWPSDAHRLVKPDCGNRIDLGPIGFLVYNTPIAFSRIQTDGRMRTRLLNVDGIASSREPYRERQGISAPHSEKYKTILAAALIVAYTLTGFVLLPLLIGHYVPGMLGDRPCNHH